MRFSSVLRSEDRGVFPQGFLRFLAICARMKCPTVESCRMFLATSQVSGRHADHVERIERALATGSTLSVEVERMGTVFPEWLGPLLNWGNKCGQPAEALEESARILELDARIQSSVQARLTYPVILLVISGLATAYAVSIGEWIFSIEAIAPPFGSNAPLFDANWPMAAAVIRFSAWMSLHGGGIALILVAILVAFSCALLVPEVPGSGWARALAERLIPAAGRSRKLARQALQSRLLARALESGVPLHEAIEFVESLSWSNETRRRFTTARRAIEQGTPLTEAFQSDCQTVTFPDLVAGCLDTGGAPAALRDLARDLGEEAIVDLDHMGRSVTPAAVLVAGALLILIPAGQYLNLIRILDALCSA